MLSPLHDHDHGHTSWQRIQEQKHKRSVMPSALIIAACIALCCCGVSYAMEVDRSAVVA